VLSKRLGSRTLRRGAVSIVVGLLAVATMTSVAMARPVQAVTIAGQTPSPVIVGNTATFTVQYVANPDGVAHGFAVTAVSGATGLSVVSGGCVSIPAYGMANLGLVQIGTTTATPTGVLPITLTVTEFASSLDCSSSSGNVGQTVATTLDTALPPLTVTMYKEICPSYSDVPANAHGSPDDTGGHAGEEKSGYSAKPITWDNSNAVGCALAVSVTGLVVMLIQGCKPEKPADTSGNTPSDTTNGSSMGSTSTSPKMVTSPEVNISFSASASVVTRVTSRPTGERS